MNSRKGIPPTERKTPIREINPVKHFEKILSEPDCEIREEGMKFFEGLTPNAKKKGVIFRALSNEYPSVRKWALEMLKGLKHEVDDNDLLVLDDLLKVSMPQIRQNAVTALGIVCSDRREKEYLEFAYEVLTTHLENENNASVIRTSVEILWSIVAAREKNRSFQELLLMLSEENTAFRDSTLEQIKRHRELLTSTDLDVVENMLFESKGEKQMAVLAALEVLDKPYSTVPILLSFLEKVEEPDKDAIKMAIRVMGDMRQVKEIDEKNIVDFLDSLAADPRFRDFGLAEFIRLVLDDTARVTPPDGIVKKRTLPEPLELSEITKPAIVKKDENPES
jgi:hypothetical protein